MKLRHLLFCAAALLASPLACRADGLPDLGEAAQSVLSPQEEKRIGEDVMREIRAGRGYVDDAELREYINNLGYRLVSNSPDNTQEFEFFLVKDRTLNAFALPGGFIGVHTGLINAAQSESELAAVLAHEVAHVTQRHLARLINRQSQSSITSLAAIAVAILAARSNSQVAQAAIATAQASAMQTQLDFTREHEREADRIGLQILSQAGFDVRAMPAFFERLQKHSRLYENNAPEYLRTHPVTSDRIADAQNRVERMPYKQSPDSLEFQLVRAKIMADDGSARQAVSYFEDKLQENRKSAGARYGLVRALMRSRDFTRAGKELAQLQSAASSNPMIENLSAELAATSGDWDTALTRYRSALKRYSTYRPLVYGYADALLRRGQADGALALTKERQSQYASDPRLYELQARAYAAQGKKLLQHQAQAEAYVRSGNVPGAIEQLQIALKSGDGDFYQMSMVEARLHELRRLEPPQQQRKPN